MYDPYQRRMAECDLQPQKHLASLTDGVPPRPPEVEPETKKGKRAKPAKNAPCFDLSRELQRITGVDLTRIDGIDVMIAQTLLSEVGVDMTRWKTEAHPIVRGVRTGESVLGAEKTVAYGTGLARKRRVLITGEPPKRVEDREKTESEPLQRPGRTLTTSKTRAYSEFP
jgi:hypothetical protein